MKKRFFIIDGHAQMFRAFYALPRLTTPSNQPINAVYGFTAMLRKLIREERPDYLVVTFDSKHPTFRHISYKDYKINRGPMPYELQQQIPLIERIIKAYNIPIYTCEGYEADDIIGTIVKRLSNEEIEFIIITKDKDMEQLISENVKILNPQKNILLDLELFEKERGIKPSQMIDVLALTGDQSDNIPGVPGIGYKTAIKLVKEWGSVEALISNLEKIDGNKTKERLKGFAEQIRFSKYLTTINTEVPLRIDMETCRIKDINKSELEGLFQEYGFKSFN